MAITQSDLDSLVAALISGAKYVRIGDRLIEYRTQAELFAAIDFAQKSLANAALLPTSPNLIQPTFSKGGTTNGQGSGSSDGGGGPWY